MKLDPQWVPMKWAGGPLEVERLKKAGIGADRAQKMAERWADPSTLDLLKGSPVNCLVVEWAAKTAEDQAQPSAWAALIRAGKQRGLHFVGRIAAGENLAATVAAGRAAGLDAVIVKKPGPTRLDLPIMAEVALDAVDWVGTTDIYCAGGAVWPGVNLETIAGNTANGGPTGAPWVNSNGWFSMLSRQIAPGKIPWIDVAPPPQARPVPAWEYCRTIADSRVYGSRWIVELDPQLSAALLEGDSEAARTWAQIGQTLAFFEAHAEWENNSPMAALAVVSDFAGQNASSGGEVLNLLNRHQIQFLVVNRLRMKARPDRGLKGILWLDDAPPDPVQHGWLLEFARAGGVMIAAKYWGPAGIAATKEDWLPDYDIFPLEKGRIVVGVSGLPDPYQLAKDTHILIGRGNDFTRLFNPETANCYAALSHDGKKQTVQVVNYGVSPLEFLTLWVNASAKSGVLTSPEMNNPTPLACIPSGNGTEFHLPTLHVNCSVEIERPVQA